MPSIEETKKRRFQFLNFLFKKTGGDKFKHVNMLKLGKELDFPKEEVITIVQYLEGEYLLEHAGVGPEISITHDGIKEIEEALSHPNKKTKYFPPTNIINIQHMENSQIQQGTNLSKQVGTFDSSQSQVISDFIDILKSKISELGLAPDDESEINSDLNTMKSQIASSRPKSGIIKESLISIQRILEGAGGALVAQQLLPLIPSIIAAL